MSEALLVTLHAGTREAPREVACEAARLRNAIVLHHDFLWRSLRRLGVEDGRVDDALQQVFLVASRAMGAVPTEAERAFLFGVARRVASNARRTTRRQREIFAGDDLDAFESGAPSAEGLIAEREARMMLDAVLDAMPTDLREVLVLAELEQLTLVEVAGLLELPVGTATSRLRRAREAFSSAAKRVRIAYQRTGGLP